MIFGAGLLRTTIAAYNSLLFASWETDYGIEKRWLALFFDEGQAVYVPVLAQSLLTTTNAANQTYTSDVTWNNANNLIEVIAAGASGGGGGGGAGSGGGGGGGGGYSATANPGLTFATPGTTTATFRLSAGGAAVTTNVNGNNGQDAWFNGATLAGSTVGAKGGLAGVAGVSGSAAGGLGGQQVGNTGGVGSVKNSGGTGGAGDNTAGGRGGGGGGTAGSHGNGNNGSSPGAGGSGDAGSGGTAGSSGSGVGGNGAEYTTAGSGGGGGGGTGGSHNGGNAGLYGGGGGGGVTTTSMTSGMGAQALIVLTWTPSTSVVPFLRPHNPNTMRHLRR